MKIKYIEIKFNNKSIELYKYNTEFNFNQFNKLIFKVLPLNNVITRPKSILLKIKIFKIDTDNVSKSPRLK